MAILILDHPFAYCVASEGEEKQAVVIRIGRTIV